MYAYSFGISSSIATVSFVQNIIVNHFVIAYATINQNRYLSGTSRNINTVKSITISGSVIALKSERK